MTDSFMLTPVKSVTAVAGISRHREPCHRRGCEACEKKRLHISEERRMILDRLGKELLFFDGGMGTLLQEKGLAAGELPETWNLEHTEEIVDNPPAVF